LAIEPMGILLSTKPTRRHKTNPLRRIKWEQALIYWCWRY